MAEQIDFGKEDIRIILQDPRVRELLDVVEKYPMQTIQWITDSLTKPDGGGVLTIDQVRIILNRLNISSQSSRLSPSTWKQLRDMIIKEENRSEVQDIKAIRTWKKDEERAEKRAERLGDVNPEKNEHINKVGVAGSRYIWATRDKPRFAEVSRDKHKTEDGIRKIDDGAKKTEDSNKIRPHIQINTLAHLNKNEVKDGDSRNIEAIAEAGLVNASSAGNFAGEDMIRAKRVVIKDIFTAILKTFNSFFAAVKKLRITMVSPYYLLLLVLILGIIIWMKTSGFFNSEPLDISLPVRLDGGGE